MGAFDIAIACPHGLRGATVHNLLMWRAHARLLRQIVPPQGSASFTYQIGFSGPMFRAPGERPNPIGGSEPAYSLSRRGKYSDFVGDWANEGGCPSDDIRAFTGYERQTVSWEFEEDRSGVMFSTGWHTWTNRLTWTRHGDWTPSDWHSSLYGAYRQPPLWVNCPPWEGSHGYPWCEPNIHGDWYMNVPPPEGKTHPDNRNEFDLECPGCIGAGGPSAMGGYPAGCVFVTIHDGGYEQEALAAAAFKAPIGWRWGGVVSVRYRGRFGGKL